MSAIMEAPWTDEEQHLLDGVLQEIQFYKDNTMFPNYEHAEELGISEDEHTVILDFISLFKLDRLANVEGEDGYWGSVLTDDNIKPMLRAYINMPMWQLYYAHQQSVLSQFDPEELRMLASRLDMLAFQIEGLKKENE